MTYLHSVKNKSIVDGKKVMSDELIVDSDKDLKIKYFRKSEDKMEKILITHDKKNPDVYHFEVRINEEVNKQELTKKDLLKAISKMPELKFIHDYLK